MRVAILSDCHGDLVALRAVLADLDRMAPDRVVVAGDVAQGGPHPADVLDTLLQRGYPMVRGNSDDLLVQVARGAPTAEELPAATLATARQSVERLDPERLRALEELPLSFSLAAGQLGKLVVVHATPWSNEDVVLADATEELARRMVVEANAAVLAHGHIHSAYQREVEGSLLISVGAVGVSNDADPRPCYTCLDFDGEVWAEVRRVDCSAAERLEAYARSDVRLSEESRRSLMRGGDWPVLVPAGRRRLTPFGRPASRMPAREERKPLI